MLVSLETPSRAVSHPPAFLGILRGQGWWKSVPQTQQHFPSLEQALGGDRLSFQILQESRKTHFPPTGIE